MTDTIDEAVGASTVPDQIEASNGLILVAKNVPKSFGGLMAVKDMSLEVVPGTITGLIGLKGAAGPDGREPVKHLVAAWRESTNSAAR